MAEAGRRLGAILRTLVSGVRPGVETRTMDARSRELIAGAGCAPAFLGYEPHGAKRPYPAALCTSVNEVVVHGVPSAYLLRGGDVLKLDLGLVYKGWYSDAAVTVLVGSGSEDAQKLIRVTEEALRRGIRAARPGNTVGDIGHAVQSYVEAEGFSVVRTLTGHGVGRSLHEDPMVPNYGKQGAGEKLVPGMVIAIEPMISAGGFRVKQLKDDSYATSDGSLSAHFEHTVAITARGSRVLTAS